LPKIILKSQKSTLNSIISIHLILTSKVHLTIINQKTKSSTFRLF